MSKVPVLVTGGAGYIGSHAVLALKDAGWPVAVIDNLSNGSRSVVPDDVPFFEGSIADRALVDRILAGQRIGAIMHFAGSIVVPESVEKPLDYYANNTLASHALISAAVAASVKHILFSSTAAVYGAPESVPIDEGDAKLPINPYGASKLMTERMLEDASAAYPFNYGALRYFNVAGADPEGRTGQIGKGSTHLIKIAAEAAVGKRSHVAVFGTDYPTPDGTCIRDYIHAGAQRCGDARGRRPGGCCRRSDDADAQGLELRDQRREAGPQGESRHQQGWQLARGSPPGQLRDRQGNVGSRRVQGNSPVRRRQVRLRA